MMKKMLFVISISVFLFTGCSNTSATLLEEDFLTYVSTNDPTEYEVMDTSSDYEEVIMSEPTTTSAPPTTTIPNEATTTTRTGNTTTTQRQTATTTRAGNSATTQRQTTTTSPRVETPVTTTSPPTTTAPPTTPSWDFNPRNSWETNDFPASGICQNHTCMVDSHNACQARGHELRGPAHGIVWSRCYQVNSTTHYLGWMLVTLDENRNSINWRNF